jgi:hypothetical protein
MIFLGSRTRHATFWPLVIICVLFTEFALLKNLRLSFDSIFSGVLALTGFIFTARSFITIKLNDVIYSSDKYRNYIADLKKEGAYKQNLYDPLKTIDTSLANATYMCLCATVLLVAVAFVPKLDKIDMGNKVVFDYAYQIFLSKIDPAVLIRSKAVVTSVIFKIITDTALVYFGFCLYQMIIAATSLHQNINSIIAHWEIEYASWQQEQERKKQ